MNLNELIHFYLASDSQTAIMTNKLFFLLKCHLNSTSILPLKSYNRMVNRMIPLVLLLFLLLPLNLKAQPGLDNAIKIRVNDPAVTATVDNQSPKKGDNVTLTLQDIPEGKTTTVTVGNTFGGTEIDVTNTGSNTYTFNIPDHPVYIDVNIESSPSASFPFTVETPGVGAGKVSVKVEVGGVTVNAPSGYQAEVGKKVTVTLQTPLAAKLTLKKTEAFAPDGSWRWVGLSGSPAVTTLTFTMPSAAVTIRFTIEEDTTIDPPVGPVDPPVNPGDPDDPTDPDEPDNPDTPNIPDEPVDPDDPATANEPVALPGLHIQTSAGILRLNSDSPCRATVYTFGGRRVAVFRLETGVEQQQALPRGAYILHSGSHGIKFTL